jgi:rRNA maturation protein Nop10
MKSLSRAASRIFPTASLELTLLRDAQEKVDRKLDLTKCDSCGRLGLKFDRTASKNRSKLEGKLTVIGTCPACGAKQLVSDPLGPSPNS